MRDGSIWEQGEHFASKRFLQEHEQGLNKAIADAIVTYLIPRYPGPTPGVSLGVSVVLLKMALAAVHGVVSDPLIFATEILKASKDNFTSRLN